MKIRSEAELQTFVTGAFRRQGFLESVGLWSYGSAGEETKLVKCAGCDGTKRRGGALEWAKKGLSVDAVCYRGMNVVDLFGVEVMGGAPRWRPCIRSLALSAIEKGQRTSLERTRGVGPPMAHKNSDSAIGFNPYDLSAIWKGWAGYCFGWSCGDVSRFYLVPSEILELKMAGIKRGSITEADAWEWSAGRCVLVDRRRE